MNKTSSILQQAYQFIGDKKIFLCAGKKEEKQRLNEMLHSLIQTKTGRSVIFDIGNLHQKRSVAPIVLKMQKTDEGALGWANENLKIFLNRINLKGMTTAQKRRVHMMQSITLVHELVHIRQFLKGYEPYIQGFSLPHQFYANIVEELEATLVEAAFKIEVGKLYPKLAKSMRLGEATPRWRERRALSFFLMPPNDNVAFWIDSFSDFAKTSPTVVLEDKKERLLFKRWVNKYLKNMQLPFSYDDFALEKVFWAKKQPNDYLKITGADISATFDPSGRLVALGSGFEKGEDSALRFAVYIYQHNKEKAQIVCNQIHKDYPRARIFLAPGRKEQLFSVARCKDNER